MLRRIFTIALLLWSLGNANAVQLINVGAIFYEDEFDLEKTFESTIETINSHNENTFKLSPIIERIGEFDNSQVLQRIACELVDHGVAAIFGPSSRADTDIVALICNSTGIPHVLFDAGREETTEERANHQMTINVYPAPLSLSKAYADIVQNFQWRKFTIVYDADDPQAPTRLQDVLQLRDVHNEVVRVRKFRRTDDYRIMWKSIKSERRIVLDCDPDLLVYLLNASIPFDLTGQFNNLLLTNLETHSTNLEDMRDNVTFAMNMTGLRLKLNGNFYNANPWQRATLYNIDPNSDAPVRTLHHDLLYDAVHMFANAVRNITASYQLRMPRVTCALGEFEHAQSWAMGRYINRVMKATSGVNNTDYRTSDMQFDEDGQRINMGIELYDPLDNYGIAFWDPQGQIVPQHVESGSYKKLVYRVATRIGLPYFAERQEAVEQNITGNERYEGFAVDLIDAIAKFLDFDYVFIPVADNQYGKYNKDTKQWDGIIGEIINNDAHMGICDLTITQARRTVVDFTVPFMQLGIGLLAFKERAQPKDMLAFLEPFAAEVWIYVMIAVFIMSFLFVFMARISEEEWENPHPCNKDPHVLENKWGLANTSYLTTASIMTAGCDILPRSAPMRTFTSVWWIFAIIIANSYTANLAAFLTNSQMEGDINSIKDLAEQNKVKFGTMAGGSTYTFFAESNETVYRLAYNLMNSQDPSVYTKDNAEGVERVLKNRGTFMFLMETTSIEYNIERNCQLRMLGEKFGEKHYAIAVPFGAEYRSRLSVAILKLSERGKLFEMKQKWWKNGTCDEGGEDEEDDDADMDFMAVRGIFYSLFMGVFVAYCFGICEFLTYTHHIATEQKMTFKEAFFNEMRFVLRIWNNKKPISRTPTASINASSRRDSEKTLKSSRRNTAPEEELQVLQNGQLKSGLTVALDNKLENEENL